MRFVPNSAKNVPSGDKTVNRFVFVEETTTKWKARSVPHSNEVITYFEDHTKHTKNCVAERSVSYFYICCYAQISLRVRSLIK